MSLAQQPGQRHLADSGERAGRRGRGLIPAAAAIVRAQASALPRLPQATQFANQRPQDQRAAPRPRSSGRAVSAKRVPHRRRRRPRRAETRRSGRCRPPSAGPAPRRCARPWRAAPTSPVPAWRREDCPRPARRSTEPPRAPFRTRSASARARNHPGSAAVSTGQIGTHTPCFSKARTHGASLAFLVELAGDDQTHRLRRRTRRDVEQHAPRLCPACRSACAVRTADVRRTMTAIAWPAAARPRRMSGR